MSKKANPGRTDLVSSPEAGWGQPQNGPLFLRWRRGRVREKEGTGHSTWVITPANTRLEGRYPVGILGRDSLVGQLVRGKEGGS